MWHWPVARRLCYWQGGGDRLSRTQNPLITLSQGTESKFISLPQTFHRSRSQQAPHKTETFKYTENYRVVFSQLGSVNYRGRKVLEIFLGHRNVWLCLSDRMLTAWPPGGGEERERRFRGLLCQREACLAKVFLL